MKNSQSRTICHTAFELYHMTPEEKKRYNKEYCQKNKDYWVRWREEHPGQSEKAEQNTRRILDVAAGTDATLRKNQLGYDAAREAQKLGNLGRKVGALISPSYTGEDATRDTANAVRSISATALADSFSVGAKAIRSVMHKTIDSILGDKGTASQKLKTLGTGASAVGSILKSVGKLAVKNIGNFLNSFGNDPFKRG